MTKKKDIFDDLILPSDEEINKETHRENNKRAITQPDVARRKSEATKRQWADGRKNAVENIREASTKKWKDPAYRIKQEETRKLNGQYTDPVKAANFKSPIIGTCKKTGKEIVFLGAKQLKDAGFEPGNVYNCINGIRKSTGGYTWKRA
jgi:hypothetical protein